jgi:predicted transcriptional regulator
MPSNDLKIFEATGAIRIFIILINNKGLTKYRICKELEIHRSTLNRRLKSMAKMGFLMIKTKKLRKEIYLTDKGKQIANLLYKIKILCN